MSSLVQRGKDHSFPRRTKELMTKLSGSKDQFHGYGREYIGGVAAYIFSGYGARVPSTIAASKCGQCK